MTKLRDARETAGLRRDFVANQLKISPDHLNLIERGKQPLSVKRIEVLARLYNLTFEKMARIALETIKEEKVSE